MGNMIQVDIFSRVRLAKKPEHPCHYVGWVQNPALSATLEAILYASVGYFGSAVFLNLSALAWRLQVIKNQQTSATACTRRHTEGLSDRHSCTYLASSSPGMGSLKRLARSIFFSSWEVQ